MSKDKEHCNGILRKHFIECTIHCDRIILIFSILFICCYCYAGDVSRIQARIIAEKILGTNNVELASNGNRRAINNQSPETNPFYIFNAQEGSGFVIVSGSTLTEPIIAFSKNGSFSPDSLPEAVKIWLQCSEEQIRKVEALCQPVNTQRDSEEAIEPLLSTQWHQTSPYNSKCPIQEGENCLTGCVATAMAQIMNYFQWPQDTVAFIEGYISDRGVNVEYLNPTAFKWGKMKNNYDYEDSGEETDAVAELIRYCGQAINTDYGLSGSTASVSPEVMIRYFDYSNTTRNVSRSHYSTLHWEQLILNELKEGRPVLYSNVDHSYICDGYDGNWLFHINWGWGGRYDGYYLLSVLNPYEESIYGEAGGNGFNIWQSAIIGIQPNHGEDRISEIYSLTYWLTEPDAPYTREGQGDFKGVELTGGVVDYKGNSNIDHAWILYKGDEQVAVLATKPDISIVQNESYSVYAKVDFGTGLEDGEYYIRQCYRSDENQKWIYCLGSSTDFYIAYIEGEKLTLSTTNNIEAPLQINSVRHSGLFRQNRTMSLVVNITNNGYSNEQPLFLWLGPDKILAGKSQTNLGHGESGDMTIYYIPSDVGEQTIVLTGTRGGNDTLWNGTVNILPSVPQKIECDISIKDMRNEAIEDTTIVATFTLRNTGDNVFDDKIVYLLYPFNDKGHLERYPIIQKFSSQTIEIGEAVEKEVLFDGLDKGRLYMLQVVYFDQNRWRESTHAYCSVGIDMKPTELNIDIIVKNSKENNEIEGGDIEIDVIIENKGEQEYCNTIDFMVWDTTGENPIWKEQTQHFEIQILPGETIHRPVLIKGLEIGHNYSFGVYYYSENIWTQGLYYSCKIVEGAGISTTQINNEEESVECYTVTGIRRSRCEGKGIHIHRNNKDTSIVYMK